MIVLPLYVPHERLAWSTSLTLSSEAHGRIFYNPTDETRDAVARDLARAVNDDGVPFLERVGRLEGFRAYRHQHQQAVLEETGSFWHAEEVGYTDILLGDFASAEEQLLRQSRPDDDDRPWVAKSRQRCAHMLDLLRRDPASVEAQLAQWAAHSATAALRLKWRGLH
jgi:hypothetical protein